ncbi:hypothetical protein GC173_18785 [bacterium]|nr:hypothetical protein [bacterium]
MLRHVLLFLAILLLVAGAKADTVVARNPDGSSTNLSGVTILGMGAQPGAPPQLMLQFPDGSQNPVEFSRIASMQFEPARSGNMMIGQNPQAAQTFPAVLVRFENGSFVAREVGSNREAGIPASSVFGFSVEAAPAAAAAGGGNPFGGTPASDPFAASGTPSGSTGGGDVFAGASGGDTGGDDSDYQMTPEEEAEYAQAEADFKKRLGLGLGYLAAIAIWLLLFAITYFWLMINAFMNGKVGWGIGIMLCGCVVLVKAAYLSNYEGKGKNAVSVLVIIEIVTGIILNVVSRLLD